MNIIRLYYKQFKYKINSFILNNIYKCKILLKNIYYCKFNKKKKIYFLLTKSL